MTDSDGPRAQWIANAGSNGTPRKKDEWPSHEEQKQHNHPLLSLTTQFKQVIVSLGTLFVSILEVSHIDLITMDKELRRLMQKRLASSEAEAAAAISSSDFAKAGLNVGVSDKTATSPQPKSSIDNTSTNNTSILDNTTSPNTSVGNNTEKVSKLPQLEKAKPPNQQKVAAVPQAVMAPRQGNWWDADQDEWVYTDTIPDSDYNLLKGIGDELGASSRPMEGGDDVKKPNHQHYTTRGIHQDRTYHGPRNLLNEEENFDPSVQPHAPTRQQRQYPNATSAARRQSTSSTVKDVFLQETSPNKKEDHVRTGKYVHTSKTLEHEEEIEKEEHVHEEQTRLEDNRHQQTIRTGHEQAMESKHAPILQTGDSGMQKREVLGRTGTANAWPFQTPIVILPKSSVARKPQQLHALLLTRLRSNASWT